MQKNYSSQTAGGKGNMGMFIERDPKVCPAGIPSAQPEKSVVDCLKHYLLQEEVDSLVRDSIKPDPKPGKLPPLRRASRKDNRNAGYFSEVKNTIHESDIVNPPVETKFKTLVLDFKNTVYSSYWKKSLGTVPDPTPTFPKDFDYKTTTLGKKTDFHGRLYDIIMPLDPLPDKTPAAKGAAFQTDRNYCRPAFNPDNIFGKKTNPDHHGKWTKLCLRDDRVSLGLFNMVENKQAVDFYNTKRAPIGKVLTPNHNITCVPPEYSFGLLKPPDNLPECLTYCKTNPDRKLFSSCLKHLNTLRKCLRTRFDKTFFANLYLNMKYLDERKTGWLPKQLVYEYCHHRFIMFNHRLLEPLLDTFKAYDGTQINYRVFVDMINHTIPTPELPKVWDIPDECVDYCTTYSEMVKPDQKANKSLRAGVPSGRYFDLDYPITPNGYCKANRTYLPQESDVRSCLNPSTLTLLGVSHRDMYAKRTPEVIKKVFEAFGEKITDEKFETVWNAAKNEHSQGWVSYETFRVALDKINSLKT